LSWRQGSGDLYRRSSRTVLAGGDHFLRDLAAGRAHHPLLIALSARSERCNPLPALPHGANEDSDAVPGLHRAALLAPRRQYRTPAARRGGAHWREKDLIRARNMPAARSAIELSDRQRLSWLRLIRSENVGPATFRALVNQFGGAEAALDTLPALSRRGGHASIRVFTQAEAEAELELPARPCPA